MAVGESREQTFTRLANKRMNKTLKGIRLLENLKAYPHTLSQVGKMVTALRAAVDKVEVVLGGEKEKKVEASFNLDDDDEEI